MNLVFKTDVKKTEAALNRYKEANAGIIKANAGLERNEAAAIESRQTYEKERASLRRQAALQEQRDGVSVKASAAGQPTPQGRIFDEGPVSDPSGLVNGLRRIRERGAERSYDAFMGMATTRDYYELRPDYPSVLLSKAKNDNRTKAGGFDFQAYFDEGMLRAFAGLGCFIDEEHAGRDQGAS